MLIIGALLAATATAAPRQAPVEVMTPAPPIPVLADGRRVLAYELHITNFGRAALTLTRIDVYSGSSRIEFYSDSTLEAAVQQVGAPMERHAGDAVRIEPGQRVIAFLWIAQPVDAPLPVVLRHQLTFGESTIDSIMVPIRHGIVPVLGPPVQAGEWLAGNGPSNASDHRRSVVPLDGAARIAQRFAIDWVAIGKNGNTVHDDEHRNENFWGFRTPVLAVADGEVTDVVDSIADNTPRSPLATFTIATIAGNYVIIRIAPRCYVLLAHLERGSIRVHPHQRVRRGDVLALLGNSGQATAPHLHMQVMDAASPLASEGVPFVLDAYTSLGNGADFEENRHPTIPKRREMPTENEVVGFASR